MTNHTKLLISKDKLNFMAVNFTKHQYTNQLSAGTAAKNKGEA